MNEGSGLPRSCAARPGTGEPPSGWSSLSCFSSPPFAPVIAPRDPLAQSLTRGCQPSASHWLGQDSSGATSFRLIHGARLSLAVGLGTVGISPSSAWPPVPAGFPGRVADRIFTGACDVLLAFPGILLAIGIAAVRGPSFETSLRPIDPRIPARPVIRAGAIRQNEGVRRVGPRRGHFGAPAPAPHPPQRDLPDPRGGDLIARAIVAEADSLPAWRQPPAASWGR